MNDNRNAIGSFTRVIAVAPEDVDAYVRRARAQQAQGDSNAAYQDLSRAVEIDPADALAFYLRGRILHDGGREAQARNDLAKAYQLGLDTPWLAEYVATLGQ